MQGTFTKAMLNRDRSSHVTEITLHIKLASVKVVGKALTSALFQDRDLSAEVKARIRGGQKRLLPPAIRGMF